MADTRRDRRAPVALKVRFKSATLDEFIEQYAQDISKGGAFIKAKKPMAVGTLLKFEFRLQDDSSIIRGVGRVVWCRSPEEADAERPAGMGIKFIKMDPESRSLVERIVSERGGQPGRFDQAGDRPTAAGPAPGGESKPFFPETTPQEELPPPEERTVVRHASEFLAQALADIDEEAAAEAKARAEEAERRAREREEAARRTAQQEEAKAEAPAEASEPSGGTEEAPAEPPEPAEAAPSPSADEPVEPAASAEAEPAEAPPPEEGAPLGAEASAEPSAGEAPSAARPSGDAGETAAEPPQREVPTEPPAERARPAAETPAAQEGSGGSPLVWVLAVAAVAAIGYLGWQATRSEQPPAAPDETAAAGAVEPPQAPGAGRQAPSAEPTKAESPAAGLAPAGAAAKPPEEQAKEAPGDAPPAGGEATGSAGDQAPSEAPGDGSEAPEAQPPAMVSVRIVTRPPGATVRVDGEERGEAPLQIDLPEGREVLVEAKLAGHRAVAQRWTPGPGETRLRLALAPLPVVVAVRSEPPGARVRIEGQRVTAPGELTLPARPTRPVRLVATLDGYRRTVVKLAPDAFREQGEALRAEVTVKLEPKPAPSARQGARPAGGNASQPSSGSPAGDASGSDDSGASGGSAAGSEEPPPEQRPEPSAPPAREEPSPPAGGGGGGAEPIPDNPF